MKIVRNYVCDRNHAPTCHHCARWITDRDPRMFKGKDFVPTHRVDDEGRAFCYVRGSCRARKRKHGDHAD